MSRTVEQSHEERDKRQPQLDAIDKLSAVEPLPVPESLSAWKREYSRLKAGEKADRLPKTKPQGGRPE